MQEIRRFDYDDNYLAPQIEIPKSNSFKKSIGLPGMTFEEHREKFCSWEPEFAPAFAINRGIYEQSKEYKFIINNQTQQQLGVVKAEGKYHILSNLDQFAAIDPIIKSGKAAILKSGYWDDGKTTFIKLRTPVQGEIVPGEGPTFLDVDLIHHTNGCGAYIANCVTYRQICANGMMAIDKNKNSLSFRIPHCKDVVDRHNKILNVIEKFVSRSDDVWSQLKKLSNIKCTDKNWDDIMKILYPAKENGELTARSKNSRESILWHTKYALGGSGDKQEVSLYEALQGVTSYFNHGKQNTKQGYISPMQHKMNLWTKSLAIGSDCNKQAQVLNYLYDVAT